MEDKKKPFKGKVHTDSELKAKSKSWFTDLFLAEDMDATKTDIIKHTIVPGIKSMFFQSLQKIFDMEIPMSKSSSGSRTSYTPYSSRNEENYTTLRPKVSEDHYTVAKFDVKEDAEYALSQMIAILRSDGIVTVSDYYDIVNLPECVSAADSDWGWTRLNTADVIRDSGTGKYMMRLPKTVDVRRR